MTVPESFPSQVCAIHFGFQYLVPIFGSFFVYTFADHIFLWKEPTMCVLVFSLGHLKSTPYNYRRVIFCVSQNKWYFDRIRWRVIDQQATNELWHRANERDNPEQWSHKCFQKTKDWEREKVETIDINCKIMITDCVGAKTLLVAFVRYRPDYRHIQMHRFAFIDSLSYLMVVLLKRYKNQYSIFKTHIGGVLRQTRRFRGIF